MKKYTEKQIEKMGRAFFEKNNPTAREYRAYLVKIGYKFKKQDEGTLQMSTAILKPRKMVLATLQDKRDAIRDGKQLWFNRDDVQWGDEFYTDKWNPMNMEIVKFQLAAYGDTRYISKPLYKEVA